MPSSFARPFLRLLLASGLLLSFAACAKRESAALAGLRTKTLHANGRAEPRDFDPQTTTHPADIDVIRGVLEGLTELDAADCHPVPGVAETWSVSPDGLTWTFKLRADARWSNGDAVTARDFVFAYQRILSPALGAEYREQFACLKNAEAFTAGKVTDFASVGVRAIDDRTLVFILEHPVPYLPTLVSQVCWFPLHRATVEKFGRIDQRATAWTRPGNFVGNGAFTLAEWQQAKHVRLLKSQTYWDRANVKLNEVYFYPIENPSVGEAGFRAGQLHVTPLPLDKIAAYQADPARAPLLHEAPLLSTQFFRINCRQAPLNDVRVRRALSLAVDREQLARRVVKCDFPAYAFTPPNCAGYDADRTLKSDVAEAKRLLAEAGFPDGKGFPKLEFLFYIHKGPEQPVAETLQQMWRANLGIEIALVRQEMKTVLSARRTASFQLLSSNWTGDYLDATTFLDLLRRDASNNATGWSQPEYDKLLDQANLTVDPAARFALLRRAEALMLAEMPIVPLYFAPDRALRVPELKGWHQNLLDLHPLKFVSLESTP
jgi:oligopeptide transport system substrate-binding protein